MEASQIQALARMPESEELEFKENYSDPKKTRQTICAFANTNGGVLLFGIKKDGKISGIRTPPDQTQQKISAFIQTVHPTPSTRVEVIQLEEKTVVAVTVQRTDSDTFYSYSGSIYVRVGSTNRRLEAPEMVEFLQAKNILRFDEHVNHLATLEHISEKKITQYLKAVGKEEYLATHDVESFLLSKMLAKRNGELALKNAAIMLFSEEPTNLVPQAELKLVKFSGDEAVDISAYHLLQGPLDKQAKDAEQFLRENLPKQVLLTGSSERVEKHEVPLDVLREAIVNAIVHRDYFSRDAIQVNMFSDRIEITSPGGLPQGLTRELLGTLSVQRNPLIYQILRDLRLVEGLGTGIPRMKNSMRSAGLPDPIFDARPQMFRVILRKKGAAKKPIEEISDLNERQKRGLMYVLDNHSVKSAEYAQMNDVSSSTAVSDINELVDFGYLKKVGSYRGAYYVPGDRLKKVISTNNS